MLALKQLYSNRLPYLWITKDNLLRHLPIVAKITLKSYLSHSCNMKALREFRLLRCLVFTLNYKIPQIQKFVSFRSSEEGGGGNLHA